MKERKEKQQLKKNKKNKSVWLNVYKATQNERLHSNPTLFN